MRNTPAASVCALLVACALVSGCTTPYLVATDTLKEAARLPPADQGRTMVLALDPAESRDVQPSARKGPYLRYAAIQQPIALRPGLVPVLVRDSGTVRRGGRTLLAIGGSITLAAGFIISLVAISTPRGLTVPDGPLIGLGIAGAFGLAVMAFGGVILGLGHPIGSARAPLGDTTMIYLPKPEQ